MKISVVEKDGFTFGKEDSVPHFSVTPKALYIDKPGLEYLIKRLSNAIEELPSEEILVLSLYHYEKLTIPEIGEILGITQQKVHHIYSHAILNLRRKVPDLKAN